MNHKGIIFYTDCLIKDPVKSMVREYLLGSKLPITSASLNSPITFGDNAVIKDIRGYPAMVRQIISCLERSVFKYVFFCEQDVLYSKSHFEFVPPEDNIFYYDTNVWRWWIGSDKAIRHDRMMSLSSLCVNRQFALDHYLKRLHKIKEKKWDKITGGEPQWARRMGYEPGTKKIRRGGFSDDEFGTWNASSPSIDIRHKGTFSNPKTKLQQFNHAPRWWKEISIDDIKDWDLRTLFRNQFFKK